MSEQKSDDSTGLMFYNARYYDATLGRFTQADTIVPNVMDPQSFNRYSYVNNNPVRYVDPTGHMLDEPDDGGDNNNGGGGFVDDRPYCEKFPYASGCDALTPPTDNGSNQNPDTNGGDSCWPRCNRNDEADAQAQDASYPQEARSGKCPGNCFPPASGPDPTKPDKAAGYGRPDIGGNSPTGGCTVTAIQIIGCKGYDPNFRPNAPRSYPEIKPGSSGGATAGKKFPPSVRAQAFKENPDRICVYCRREGIADQVDHAIPKARGGEATIGNAQLTCGHCNASKGARDFPVNPPPGFEGMWPPPWW